ncbi:MAG TPA: DUF58 domain-containing protein [Candidatus Dormibacteraeota bacterium]|nr:DUF58 domain-containing protein [Candidatus Dormibacteraeota bacterium]
MLELGSDTGARTRPRRLTLSTRPSSKLVGYSALGVVFLLGAVLLGRAEAAEIGIAFFAAVMIGVATARRPQIELTVRLEQDAVTEHEPVELELKVTARQPVRWMVIDLATPTGVRRTDQRRSGAISIDEGERRKLVLEFEPLRWGLFQFGPISVAAHDSLGFFTYESTFAEHRALRVFPHEELLMRAIRPFQTQLYAGDEVSRRNGDGIEFADVRPFQQGDRVRRINWRVSTRQQQLHINEMHPERNADVVIFLDSFTEIGDMHDSTLQMAVRATAATARHYLRRRDRVGLVTFGGTLRWQLPGVGLRQAYRIVDALLSTDSMLSYAWKSIDVIPVRTLPPKALVIAITPLLDARTTTALLDLRGRGFDLVIVEVSPLPFIAPPRTEDEKIAYRLWLLKREAMRYEYWRAGIPIAVWSYEQPLIAALQEVEQFRRYGRNLRIS